MVKINSKNINNILEDNKSFKGNSIDSIKYDINKEKIEIIIDNIKLVCKGIKECDIREYFSWEKMEECYLDIVKFNSMDMMCFATNKDNPAIYIVCDEIVYNIKK